MTALHYPEMGDVLFASRARALHFKRPVEILSAGRLSQVVPLLERAQARVTEGFYAAGFLSYEAAPAFDAALLTRGPSEAPLLWLGVYQEAVETPLPPLANRDGFSVGAWRALVSREDYLSAVARIREYIAAGDTYQVNYTFPLEADFAGAPEQWFWRLCRAQSADYCAYVDAGRFAILSASPELFFRLSGETIETRPMKGTRRRGRWLDEDRDVCAGLAASEKDRAENVMIVDLLRNDLGRISDVGSVAVRSLFDVERYETVWQMTSAICATTRATVPEILGALFPCGSVTGAPKVRTMQIIRELEPYPRGVYCGAVGWWGPGCAAEFNVAIRTVTLDKKRAKALYNVGGGITWGSTPEGEYEECLTKAALLARKTPDFDLLESFLFDGEYFLLDEHLRRLRDSADYFGVRIDADEILKRLKAHARDIPAVPHKVRLLVAADASLRIESAPAPPSSRVRLGLAAEPVNSHDIFLFHKTTYREMYDRAKASRPDCQDVLLWNERNEITESVTANVVVKLEGRWVTPPIRCGLLAGTMRHHLLERGDIQERVVTLDDLEHATDIRLINSVRQWIDVEWAG